MKIYHFARYGISSLIFLFLWFAPPATARNLFFDNGYISDDSSIVVAAFPCLSVFDPDGENPTLMLNGASENPVGKDEPVIIAGSIIDEKTKKGVEASVDIRETGGTSLVPGGITDSMGGFTAALTSMKSYEMLVQMMLCDAMPSQKHQPGVTQYTTNYAINGADPSRTVVNGVLRDYRTGRPLQFPVVVTDLKNNELVVRSMPDSNGCFRLEVPSSASYKLEILTSSCTDIPETEMVKYSTSRVGARKITLENIYFDFDRSEIRPEAAKILERHAALFKRFTGWKVAVTGHTDNMGSEEYNVFISRKRAEVIAEYLITKGVKKNQLETLWYGFDQPDASESTEEGRQMNRRCEFTVIKF